MKTQSFSKLSLGSLERAEAIAQRAERVPAYRAFLARAGFTGKDFFSRPLTDKSNYILPSEYSDLLSDDYENTFSIFRSSGSSGTSAFWPQLKESHAHSAAMLRTFMELTFSIHVRKTMSIVGLALGSWIGGEHFSWALKSMAIELAYPFAVFSPGNHHEEIIEMLQNADAFVDQFILFLCPSAIGHLHLRAQQRGAHLPLSKLRYIVLGEPFPEKMRQALRDKAGFESNTNFMLSIYGSADTGILAAESPATVAIRGLLASDDALPESLGISLPLPHFFHVVIEDGFLEAVEDEICITKWQGIPLIRYNLHDHVQLYDWKKFRQAILSSELSQTGDEHLTRIIKAAGDNLPNVMAVSGRTDASLILCGTNITEFMLDEALRCKPLESLVTGVYKARIGYDKDRQFLELDIELQRDAPNRLEIVDIIYHNLVQSLGHLHPEFMDDWKNMYSIWDEDREKRVLRIHCVTWPALSEGLEKGIKLRGLIS